MPAERAQTEIRIRADADNVEPVVRRKVVKPLERIERQMRRNRESARRMQSSFQNALSGLGGIAAATAGLYALQRTTTRLVQTAGRWEQALVGVGKTSGLAGVQLERLGDRIGDLSIQLGSSRNELAGLAQAAAQFGVEGSDNILDFVETVQKLVNASDLTADAAGEIAARFLALSGEPTSSIERLSDIWVNLGNNLATSESQIANFALELRKALSDVDISIERINAFAAAASSLGLQPELTRTSFQRFFTTLRSGARELTPQFRELAELLGTTSDALSGRVQGGDAGGVFSDVIKALDEAPDNLRRSIVEGFAGGRATRAQVLNTLIEGEARSGILTRSEELTQTAGGATEREFAAARNTILADLQAIFNQLEISFTRLGLKLAQDVVPAVSRVATVFTQAADALTSAYDTIRNIIGNPIISAALVALGGVGAIRGAGLAFLGARTASRGAQAALRRTQGATGPGTNRFGGIREQGAAREARTAFREAGRDLAKTTTLVGVLAGAAGLGSSAIGGALDRGAQEIEARRQARGPQILAEERERDSLLLERGLVENALEESQGRSLKITSRLRLLAHELVAPFVGGDAVGIGSTAAEDLPGRLASIDQQLVATGRRLAALRDAQRQDEEAITAELEAQLAVEEKQADLARSRVLIQARGLERRNELFGQLLGDERAAVAALEARRAAIQAELATLDEVNVNEAARARLLRAQTVEIENQITLADKQVEAARRVYDAARGRENFGEREAFNREQTARGVNAFGSSIPSGLGLEPEQGAPVTEERIKEVRELTKEINSFGISLMEVAEQAQVSAAAVRLALEFKETEARLNELGEAFSKNLAEPIRALFRGESFGDALGHALLRIRDQLIEITLVQPLIDKLSASFKNLLSGGGAGGLSAGGGGILSNLVGAGAAGGGGGFLGGLLGGGGGIFSALGSFFGLPFLADGGQVRRGGAAVVGERGAEVVSLPTGARVFPNGTPAMGGGAGGGNVFNISVNGVQDPNVVRREIRGMQDELARATEQRLLKQKQNPANPFALATR